MTPFNTEYITHQGIEVRVEYYYDEPRDAPWDDCDGHGPVRQVRASPRHALDKKPGEVILHSESRHFWLYDVQGATAKALAEGWGFRGDTAGMTRRQISKLAVQQDIEYLRGWLEGTWYYVGVVCKVLDVEAVEAEDSCWGYESLNDYHETAGQELAAALAEQVVASRAAALAAAEREAAEVAYWLDRGVVTGSLAVAESF